ncbi:hypothetical protein M5689_003483 [Euphorbia peplus]|nr:hypothetical protein M5689_003483 [Euphorbia peplus]
MDMFEEEEELMMNTAVIAVHQLFQRSHENDETNRGGSVMNHRVLDRNRFEEHERDIRRPDYSYDEVDGTPTIALSRARTIEFLEFVQIHKEIRGKSTHFQLQNDLIEQIWERYGSS